MSRKSGSAQRSTPRAKASRASRASGAGLHWEKAKDGAKGLWEILQQTRGPNKGVGVPCRVDPTDPDDSIEKAMLRSRAVDILLADHPELTATVWNNDIFVAFRHDLEALEQNPDYQTMNRRLEKRPGEDLVVRTTSHRARKDEVIEHYPRWPGAFEDKAPHEATEAQWTEWKAGLKAYRDREAAKGLERVPE